MCIVFFALNQSPIYKVVILTNRDEYLSRETNRADHWGSDSPIFGPRDLVGGGTWLGVNPSSATLATLTNVRIPLDALRPDAKSRGKLVCDLLNMDSSSPTFRTEFQDTFKQAKEEYELYNKFNLLGFHLKEAEAVYIGEDPEQREGLSFKSGVHSLSNGVLDDAWPKCLRGKEELSELIKSTWKGYPTEKLREDEGKWSQEDHSEFVDACFKIMQNPKKVSDRSQLPITGVPEEIEFALSSIFIEEIDKLGQAYGTMETTIVTVDYNNTLRYHEKWYTKRDENGVESNTNYSDFKEFCIQLQQ